MFDGGVATEAIRDEMKQLFFELIQVALEQRKCLSRAPSPEEWEGILILAQKQSMSGITFHGVELLSAKDQKPPRKTLLTWYRLSEKIKEKNILIDQRSHEILSMLSKADMRACLLKGQGMSCYYSKELQGLRQSGDIDVYADCGRERIDAFARALGQKDVDWSYRHLHLKIWNDTTVELHYHIESFFNPFKNRRFQRFVKQNRDMLFCSDTTFVAPSLTMNLFYALLHIYNHVLSSRIGLKQVIDYYFLLKSANASFGTFCHGETVEDVLKQFGLYRFAGGMMWLLQEITGLERRYMLCEPLEKDGRLLLDKIIMPINDDKGAQRSRKVKDKEVIMFVLKRSSILMTRYPSDALWSPIWLIGQRFCRITKNRQTTIK